MLRAVREFLTTRKHNARGEETPDPRPVEIPAGAKRPESLQEMVRRMVVAEDFRRMVASQGAETLEEASDFEIAGDDPEETFTAHESMAMQLEEPDGYREAAERARYRGNSGGRADSRGEDRARDGDAGRVLRDDAPAGDDDDDGARSRNRGSREKGGGIRRVRMSRDERDGD